MKKILAAVLVCSIASASLLSCKKDKDGVDCTASLNKLNNAMSAYSTDFTSVEKCNAFKAAWEAYAKGDCLNSLSADQKTMFENAVKDLDCAP